MSENSSSNVLHGFNQTLLTVQSRNALWAIFVGELLGTVFTACFTLKIMEEEGDEAVTEVKKN